MSTSVPASLPIRTSVEYEGQPYVDRPIYAKPRADLRTPVAAAVRKAFGTVGPQPILVRYETQRLVWRKS